jgi:hypothetical protein
MSQTTSATNRAATSSRESSSRRLRPHAEFVDRQPTTHYRRSVQPPVRLVTGGDRRRLDDRRHSELHATLCCDTLWRSIGRIDRCSASAAVSYPSSATMSLGRLSTMPCRPRVLRTDLVKRALLPPAQRRRRGPRLLRASPAAHCRLHARHSRWRRLRRILPSPPRRQRPSRRVEWRACLPSP